VPSYYIVFLEQLMGLLIHIAEKLFAFIEPGRPSSYSQMSAIHPYSKTVQLSPHVQESILILFYALVLLLVSYSEVFQQEFYVNFSTLCLLYVPPLI
jgi:hypothetical protein